LYVFGSFCQTVECQIHPSSTPLGCGGNQEVEEITSTQNTQLANTPKDISLVTDGIKWL
jgi:hypothetical protein